MQLLRLPAPAARQTRPAPLDRALDEAQITDARALFACAPLPLRNDALAAAMWGDA